MNKAEIEAKFKAEIAKINWEKPLDDSLFETFLESCRCKFQHEINNIKKCPKCGSDGCFGYDTFEIGDDLFTRAFIKCSVCDYKVSQPNAVIGPDFKLFRKWEKGI